ncbi:ADP-ribosylation factor-like protein 1 [Histomonas meleagridis]|uniref:ADP-ribosylation factor-like protein 1 n=1 Tax=Histomonas meleagridis TaxID=135588 RepID=UPI00355A05C5|nr:ADP-ribosylation factor-like protein 1 [Histomonas meleagridis]KAH0805215.1 ADP-ribosylation factor-like protein 1 [Histomonas meleagridis]
MGGIISSIRSWFSSKKEVKILILGLDSAGKTTILYRLSLGQYIQQVAPTVAFNLEKVEVGNLTLQIWDLGGQHLLRPYWRFYYKDNHGVVFVVDSADKERMDLCKSELHALLGEEELKGVPFVIIANKQDLDSAMKPEEISDKLALSTIKDRPWTIVPTSALKGEGINSAFEWLSEQIEEKQ